MMDFNCTTTKGNNVAAVLIVDYLYVLWISRNKNYGHVQILKFLKNKFVYSRWVLECLLNIRLEKYFSKKYIIYDFT